MYLLAALLRSWSFQFVFFITGIPRLADLGSAMGRDRGKAHLPCLATAEAQRLGDQKAVLPLKDFMLPRDDPIVSGLLKHLQANAEKSKASGETSAAWKKDLDAWLPLKGLRRSDLNEAKASIAESAWVKALPERERTLICAWSLVDPDMTSIDASQGLNRASKGHNGIVPTIIPKNRMVVFRPLVEQATVLTGAECLMLQGFPQSVVTALAEVDDEQMNDTLFRDLAGNAYSGTAFASVLIAVLVHFPAACVDFCSEWSHNVSQRPVLPVRRRQPTLDLDMVISKP